jgi:hypothetical protein
VRINEARHDPPAGGNGLRIRDWLGTNHAVDDPEVTVLALRQHHAGDVQAMPFDMLRAHDPPAPNPPDCY